MPETWKVETWREEEQEDSCSSCSSYLPLESSNDTEIITVPAEHVPATATDTVPQDTDTDKAQDTDITQTQDLHDTQAIH